LSSRIIPKGSLIGVRRAEFDDLSEPKPHTQSVPGRPEQPAAPNPLLLVGVKEEGYREGLEAGQRQAEGSLQSERAALRALSNGLAELVRDFEQRLANDLLSVSLELAKLIVRTSLKVKPDLVLSVIREAVSSLPGMDEQTSIHLHPLDAALLRELAESDKQLGEFVWKIVEDPQLERGGCRLEASTTEVDATLETRWRRIIAALGRDDPWIDITT
jgi:flagellar assembly protein FliH